jgi:anti-anti-sigma factor
MLAAASACELNVERGPGWLLVKIESLEGDGSNPPLLAERLWSLAQQHFTYRIVLDLGRVRVLNSCLIGQLILIYKRIRDHEGVLRLCGLSPYNQHILHTCSLDDRFQAYDSREEAMVGGCDPRLPR